MRVKSIFLVGYRILSGGWFCLAMMEEVLSGSSLKIVRDQSPYPNYIHKSHV